jgi:arylsulfatase A-like enzyme
MVWDGMRPDLVSTALTPNLWRLAADGTWFDASHAVFPTVTRINSASIASGASPATHGLPGNALYAPRVDPSGPISLGEADNVLALRREYGVFGSATTADVVAEAGGRTVIVSTGTRGSALMCHPRVRERGDLMLHPTLSTFEELAPIVERFGPLPPATTPNTGQNRWFARAVADYVLPELSPELLVVWHNDPDKSQHRFGFGHPESLRAIRDADAHLGLILDALERLGLRRGTAVVVVSDHGYASVGEQVDLAADLAAAGLKASPESTDVVVAPNGGAVMVYLPNPADGLDERVAAFLRRWPATEVIFSGARGRRALEGAFPVTTIEVDGPLAPDFLVGLAWGHETNEHGHAGTSAENGRGNRASHGGIGPWEIRNTLASSGAGVRPGVRSPLPAGNVDVAPTVLTLLGLPIPSTMQGRVLAEGLTGWTGPEASVTTDATRLAHDGIAAELVWSSVDGRRYLDYGRRLR